MGSRLRTVRQSAKREGKGKLTEALIRKLTNYDGLAIRRNSESGEEMQKVIMATFFHMISTNKKPLHQNCPVGFDSRCKWRIAEAAGDIKNHRHPPALHPKRSKKISPIYKDLSRLDLLERCLESHTQNANESFNSTVWRLVHKHLYGGFKIVEMASFLAVGQFNEG
ncbi:hypothetical protein WN55_10082 [Dufourea novaeangliae]|uniref:Uncharacterized protein n=1 Tax=Dufourea novaeangliae TaxID=178035 RepID=A0A154P7N1_DUFNO|nr:hypothetical protein WN55_10082 [Dufourea novaeangliae]